MHSCYSPADVMCNFASLPSAMEATQEIGLIIVGAAGYRGHSALEILPKLRAEERAKGIHLRLVSLAEANENSRAALPSQAAALAGSPRPVVGMLSEAIPVALQWLADGQTRRKLLVYDATPAAHHYLHLMTVLPYTARGHIFYLGEKPLFTDQGQIDFIERNFARQTFFCELIETENPAFRAASEFLLSEPFQIERMTFWRASCMGVLLAAGDGRAGAEGGALLDKAPHDLSVSLGLVGPRFVERWSVTQARTHLLALHEDAFRLGKRNFLSVAGTSLSDTHCPARIPQHQPADALASFEVHLTLGGNLVVPVSYIASWVGMQNTPPELTLSSKLASLGLAPAEWQNHEAPQLSSNRQYRYQNQEVRIALIEGLLGNRQVQVVLNLLAKFAGHRFVHLIGEDRRREILFEEKDACDYHDSKEADLFAVFQRVVEHCAGLRTAENVATGASLLVHKIMLGALLKAHEQLPATDQDAAYRASAVAYAK